MTRVIAFGRFVWDFVVGDDWRIAAGVAISLGVTALVAGAGAVAWWIVPVAVMLLLTFSVWRVGR
jgi:hypothetical protein